jgi:hypothetical protein
MTGRNGRAESNDVGCAASTCRAREVNIPTQAKNGLEWATRPERNIDLYWRHEEFVE